MGQSNLKVKVKYSKMGQSNILKNKFSSTVKDILVMRRFSLFSKTIKYQLVDFNLSNQAPDNTIRLYFIRVVGPLAINHTTK